MNNTKSPSFIDEADKSAKKNRQATRLAEKLQQLPFLPDNALVPLPVVCAIRGRSSASIWRDVKAGRCPAPVNAGPRCTRWKLGDLRATPTVFTEVCYE